MPPRDPRLCPALETAPPDAVKNVGVLSFPELWKVRFGGKAENWHAVRVTARNISPPWREVVHCYWSIAGSTWTEDYFFDGSKMNRVA